MDTEFYSDDTADFWESYRKGRPDVPESLFQKVFDYHQRHGGAFESAHDIGAGPGIHSGRLNRFKHVKISDISEKNIEIAKLQHPEYECHVMAIEDLKDDTNDLVFASTCLHWTDITKAIQAIYRNLKPGGTFVAVLVGLCSLHDPVLQEIWARFWNGGYETFIDAAGGLTPEMRTSLELQANFAEALSLPESQFEHVERFRINDDPSGNTFFSVASAPRYGTKRVSNAKPGDKLTTTPPAQEWSFHKSLPELKQIIDSFPFDQNDIRVKGPWQELEKRIGDGKVEGVWMAQLVLATKIVS